MTLLQHYWFKRAFSNQQLFLNWNTVAQCKPRRLCSPRPLLGIHPALKSRDLVIVAVLGRGVCVKRVAPLARTTNTRALSKQFLKTHTHTSASKCLFSKKCCTQGCPGTPTGPWSIIAVSSRHAVVSPPHWLWEHIIAVSSRHAVISSPH